MWLGEQITKRGVGNGISILIFASILASAPARHSRLAERLGDRAPLLSDRSLARPRHGRLRAGRASQDPDPVREGEWWARRTTAGAVDVHAVAREHGGRDPGDLRGRVARAPADTRRFRSRRRPSSSTSYVQPGTFTYLAGEALLIVVFTFFYTAVQFNPRDQAPTTCASSAATSPGSAQVLRPPATSTVC